MAGAMLNTKMDRATMELRVVRYADLVPCYNAFIDCRTPGSEAKENFTIIGPGVSENPAQHVHITEPHGYNIGGARQPPGCVNSQHSHATAEVFVVHSGQWRFDLGEYGEDASVVIGRGDVITLPTDTFRGFTNVGQDTGFLWAVLGQDDPGRVTWAPKVFELAREYGLVLLESGQLIDTAAGEQIPAGAARLRPTGSDEVARMKRLTASDAAGLVWRAGEHPVSAEPIISPGGHFAWPHGFSLERRLLAAGETTRRATTDRAEVVFVHAGDVRVEWGNGTIDLGSGDTMTIPAGLRRTLSSQNGAAVYAVQATA